MIGKSIRAFLVVVSLAVALASTSAPARADFSNGHSHFTEVHRNTSGWKYSYFDDNFGYNNSIYIFTDTSVRFSSTASTIAVYDTKIQFATNGGSYMALRNWHWARSDGTTVASGFGFTRSHGGNASWNCVESAGWCGEVSVPVSRTFKAFTFFGDVVDAQANKFTDTVTLRIYPTG
jgi:hypothetical protein